MEEEYGANPLVRSLRELDNGILFTMEAEPQIPVRQKNFIMNHYLVVSKVILKIQ